LEPCSFSRLTALRPTFEAFAATPWTTRWSRTSSSGCVRHLWGHRTKTISGSTQFLFWLLAAIDGHAKNFSVFIDLEGRFGLTPRYDVLSAYPVFGGRRGQLSPHTVKMAMAVHVKNRHYKWKEIRIDHWIETARLCGLPHSGRKLMEEFLNLVPAAVRAVREKLPGDFPTSVNEPILDGFENAAARALEALALHSR
jgi:serine/threonine-protein kinase HipA